MKLVIYMTNLEITNFNVEHNDDVNVITQYFPYGKWSSTSSYVLTLCIGEGQMLVLNLGSKKVSQMIIDALEKLNHKSSLNKDNMLTCVID